MPDLRKITANSELLFSWGRYVYWADLMFRDWDKFMTEKGAHAKKAKMEWLGVSSYWAASLYVVIEGWEAAKFTDPIVDALLGVSNYKEVLRRLRNGTFHYQSAILSQKVTEFFQTPDVTLWLYFLHEEFCRWLRDCVEAVEHGARLSPEQSQEWRDECVELFGWLPLRPAEQELESLRKLMAETRKELDASGSDSEATKELRASLGGYDTAVKETAALVRQYRRDLLAQLGLNPDSYIP
jgi:hypothetical protein